MTRPGYRKHPPDPPARWAMIALALALVLVVLVVSCSASAATSPRERAARAVFVDVFGPRLAPCFVSIARRETGGTFDPRAANWNDRHSDGSRGSFGLLQIGAVHRHAGESVAAFARRMFDPRSNAIAGRALYRAAGLRPWGGSCS